MASSLKMPPVTGYGLSTLGLALVNQRAAWTRLGHLLRMHVQNAARAAESLVPAAKVDRSDAVLAKHGGAHDAWLDSDIEVRLTQDADGLLRQDAGNGNELGMSGAVERAVGLVHSSADDLAVLHEHTTDRRLITGQCKLGLMHVIGQLQVAKQCSRGERLTMPMASRMKRS